MGADPAAFAYNISGCPGPLQLLPNHVYQKFMPGESPPWLTVGSTPLDLSDIYNLYRTYPYPGLIGPTDQAQQTIATPAELDENRIVNEMISNLTSAEQFHKAVEKTGHMNTLVVYSDGLDTEVRFEFEAYPANATQWVQPAWALNGGGTGHPLLIVHKEPAGDGTVPAVSGKCPALTLAEPAALGGRFEHSHVYASDPFNDVALTFISKLLALPPGTHMGS